MSRRRRRSALLSGLVLLSGAAAACDAGITPSDRFERDYPAAKAPMLYAPSRLAALEREIEKTAASPARATSVELKPTGATALFLGPNDALGRVQLVDGVWSRDSHEMVPSEQKDIAEHGSFAVSDAHLAQLPAHLRSALATEVREGRVRAGASLNYVTVRATDGGGAEVELRIEDGEKSMFVVIDGAGQVLARRVQTYR